MSVITLNKSWWADWSWTGFSAIGRETKTVKIIDSANWINFQKVNLLHLRNCHLFWDTVMSWNEFPPNDIMVIIVFLFLNIHTLAKESFCHLISFSCNFYFLFVGYVTILRNVELKNYFMIMFNLQILIWGGWCY